MASLYVGNLPFSTTEDQLRELFADYGTVHEIKLVYDRETGQPRGFGFVEMNETDAAAASEALNGSEVEGRPLRINKAHKGSQRSPSGRRN
ncbi:MAG: RNA-binding protein [Gammaproteobacteria bacterium]|nr:RNA-binding protein [Gammaproteobacteria bacterium]